MPSIKSRYKYINQYKKNSANSIDSLAGITKTQDQEETIGENSELENSNQNLENVSEQISEAVINNTNKRLESVTLELEDWKNRAIRLTADIQNLQTQARHDENIVRKNTKKNLVNSLVSFLNTLNLAFSYAPHSDDPKIQKFINALQGSFSGLTPELNKHGIEIILPKSGDSFDPTNMTALNQSDDENLTVKQIVGIGIRIDGQLTTPASVMV